MTARCARYISAWKVYVSEKLADDCTTLLNSEECALSEKKKKNRHITILSLFCGEIIFEVFQPMWSRHLHLPVFTKNVIWLINSTTMK